MTITSIKSFNIFMFIVLPLSQLVICYLYCVYYYDKVLFVIILSPLISYLLFLYTLSGEEILDGENMYTCLKCKEKRKCTKKLSIYKYPRVLVSVTHTAMSLSLSLFSSDLIVLYLLIPSYFVAVQIINMTHMTHHIHLMILNRV